MNKRLPALSNVNPTGRKHDPGHSELSGFHMICCSASVLLELAVGLPLAYATRLTLYPLGGLRFLDLISY